MDNFPKIEIFQPIERTKKIVKGIGHFIADIVTCPHLLSPVSEHFQHPLDPPIEPVTSMPNQPEYESAGSYYFKPPETH